VHDKKIINELGRLYMVHNKNNNLDIDSLTTL